jgi:hypothetical protein
MKRLLIIVLWVLFGTLPLFSQPSTHPHQQKYWRYRQRLVSRMLRYGVLNSTNSNVFDPINITGGYSIPLSQVNRSEFEGGGYQEVKFGDATMQLGLYWAVLATEIKLLRDNGQDYSMTLRELYRAMQAFDRLDYYCESKQKFNHDNLFPSRLNGIAMRDDANYAFGRSHFYLNNFNSLKSDFFEVRNGRNDSKNNTLSRDHLAYLLVGWTCIVKCLENGDIVDNVALKNYAKAQVDRCLRKYAADDYKMLHDAGRQETAHGDLRMYSPGINSAGSRIQQEYYSKYLGSSFQANYPSYVIGRNHFIWRGMGNNDGAFLGEEIFNGFTYAFIDFYAACASDWNFGLEPVVYFTVPLPCGVRIWRPAILFCPQTFYRYNVSLPTNLGFPVADLFMGIGAGVTDILSWFLAATPILGRPPSLTINYTGNALSHHAMYNKTYLQPLVHQFLFNSNNPYISRENYRGMMNVAPFYGTFHRARRYNYEEGPQGWRVNNRFEKTRDATHDGDGTSGEFNGLDYMLMCNVYHLVNGSHDNLAGYEAEFKPFYDKHWPAGSHNVSAKSGIYFAGTDNVIMNDADVNLEAPSINITENFITEPNAYFNAKAVYDTQTPMGRKASDTLLAIDPTTLPFDSAAQEERFKNDFIEQFQEKVQDSLGVLLKLDSTLKTLAYIPECDFLAQNQDYIDFEVKEKVNLFEDELTTFPNPATQQLTLAFNLQNNGYAKVTIMNANGAVVLNAEYPDLQAGLQQLALDIASLNTGLYHILVETSEKVYNGKISKI